MAEEPEQEHAWTKIELVNTPWSEPNTSGANGRNSHVLYAFARAPTHTTAMNASPKYEG